MALAFAEVVDTYDVWGRTRTRTFDVTLDTSYPTGGTAITPANVGLRTLYGGKVLGGNAAAKQLYYHLDNATVAGQLKLICLFPSGGGGTSPTTLTNATIASGGTAVTSAAANGATDLTPGVGIEVGSTANLATLVVRIQFYGN